MVFHNLKTINILKENDRKRKRKGENENKSRIMSFFYLNACTGKYTFLQFMLRWTRSYFTLQFFYLLYVWNTFYVLYRWISFVLRKGIQIQHMQQYLKNYEKTKWYKLNKCYNAHPNVFASFLFVVGKYVFFRKPNW